MGVAAKHRRIILLAVVAILFFFRLLTGVVFSVFVFVFWWRAAGSSRPFEFSHPRFDLVDEADIFVILHHSPEVSIIIPLDGAGTQDRRDASRSASLPQDSTRPTRKRMPCQTTWRIAAAAPRQMPEPTRSSPRSRNRSSHVPWEPISSERHPARVSNPLVATRMFSTRRAGGSTSSSDFSQRKPASASANNGPHVAQLRACAWNLNNLWLSQASHPTLR